MRYLGIDYGTKRVGTALSDEGGMLAFPHIVLPNDEHLIAAIMAVIAEKEVGGIIVGDTRSGSGEANTVTDELANFVRNIERETGRRVTLVHEEGTTGAARQESGIEGRPRGTVQSPRARETKDIDASAAALILQRFLDGHDTVG